MNVYQEDRFLSSFQNGQEDIEDVVHNLSGKFIWEKGGNPP